MSFIPQNSLYLVLENINNGFSDIILDIFSLIAIIFSIYVIITKNPVVSVLHLIGLFAAISLFLLSLGINYLGLSYLLVYVGAISILFLFILMLINIRISELHHDTENSIPLTLLVGICINNVFFGILPQSTIYISSIYENLKPMYVSTDSWELNLLESSHIVTLGNIIYSQNAICLIIVSIVLMLSMIGCIAIVMDNGSNQKINGGNNLFHQ